MFHSEHLQDKWAPLLEHEGLDKIADPHRRAVTAVLLENQEKFLQEQNAFAQSGSLLTEAPTNAAGTGGFTGSSAAGGPVAGFDPVLISLIRRSMPNLVAYDLAGVQPMNGPTGLIFAMRSRYTNQSGTEALFDEADTGFSGQNSQRDLGVGAPYAGATGIGSTDQVGSNPGLLNTGDDYSVGTGMNTGDAETLGEVEGTSAFAEMAFSIDKVTVTARSRALKAEYTMELAQDLKAIHGLDAETELANILSTEILAEINREVVRTIYGHAKAGAQVNTTTAGTFDLDTDSNGRWSVEKFKGLLYQLERDANAIGQQTRRGKGNIIICSADVASALQMAGVLDYAPALNTNLNVDDTGNTFAGVLNGKFKVYVDPYSANVSAKQFYVAGYKGTSPYDSGLFYCPYVPLQMVRAVGQDSFQPKIGFKTRYGMVQNPFATTRGTGVLDVSGAVGSDDQNVYYRRVLVNNIM